MSNKIIIEKILDKRINPDCSVSYLVKWAGCPSRLNSWEESSSLVSMKDVLDDYEEKFNKNFKNSQKKITKEFKIERTPEKLIQLKGKNKNLFFVVKWKDQAEKTTEKYSFIRENYPYLLISFYEQRIRLNNKMIRINNINQ